MKHLSWDHGAIDDALRSALGLTHARKTSKTACGIRVPIAAIDDRNYDCPNCRKEAEREASLA